MELKQGHLNVSHVADFSRRYAGESLTLYTRVQVNEDLPGFTLWVQVPDGVALDDYCAAQNHMSHEPTIQILGGEQNRSTHLVWLCDRTVCAGESYEYEMRVTVSPSEFEHDLMSRAVAYAGHDVQWAYSETAQVRVPLKGRYIKYLPAIYLDDELMGRFLMLFESFWGPIERQIDSMHYNFDPLMAPRDLLPWLATWVNITLDEHWPEERRRQLLLEAVSLFRRRGTPRGLIDYLQIYTGERAMIVEHRANNFRLGLSARLGPAVALGHANEPHTFSVRLALLPIDGTSAPAAAGARASSPAEVRARAEADRRRIIESIIDSQKPAHTRYTLEIVEKQE
jgi:phage tail-like protein